MAIRNNLDDIVNVDIEISTPGSSDESFNNVLLVVEGPVVGKKSTDNIGTKVISVAQAGELADYGFSTESQAYIMANVAFSQSPKPSLVYVIARQVVSDESDPVTYEKISVTLDRAKEAGGWYGIALSKAFLNKADIEETIKWTEANKKIFGFTFVEQTLPVSTTNYFRSFAVYGGGVPDVEETPDENYYISLAMMAKCFGYDPGSETWGLKQLAAVYPCKLSTDMKKYCDGNYVTYFTTYAKKNVTSSMGGKVLGNEWIDTIRFRDWLKNDMQERVFNLLVLNTKVPFTDEGITAVEGKMEESLKVGQKVGGVAPTEYDDDDNEIPGYTIIVPSSASMSDVEKASRQLTGCKFTAKLAGTERGITEPTPTFSACFGQAFLELHPTKYAAELVKKMEKSGAKAYLVNTGWNGTGKRISIKDTRGIIDAILSGDILKAPTKKIPHFDFEVPTELPGVDPAILDPRDTYADAAEWEKKAEDLAGRFIKNFAKYESNEAGKALVAAGPQK